MLSGELSVRAAEGLAKKALEGESPSGVKRGAAKKDAEFKAVEESLRKDFFY